MFFRYVRRLLDRWIAAAFFEFENVTQGLPCLALGCGERVVVRSLSVSLLCIVENWIFTGGSFDREPLFLVLRSEAGMKPTELWRLVWVKIFGVWWCTLNFCGRSTEEARCASRSAEE